MIDLQKEIHSGIIQAQKDSIKWSALGLGHSAEYLIVANVAKSVAKLQDTYKIKHIYVECSIKELADEDELKNECLRTGRCDICIEDEDEYSIIEVKNTLTAATENTSMLKSIKDDIVRIELFLLNNNYFKECYVCFINANYINDKDDTLENEKLIKLKIFKRLDDFMENIRKQFIKLHFEMTDEFFIEKTSNNKLWGWQSVVLKITLKEDSI